MTRPPAAEAELLDALPLAVVVLDRELRVSAWNAAAEVLYGYDRAVAIGGDGVGLLFDVDDQAAAAELWRGVVRGAEWDGDRRVRRDDGMLLVSSFRAVPVAGGLAWIATDGMDQGLAEQERSILLSAEHAARGAAEEAHGLVEAIVSSAPIGIAVFDLDLRYTRVNAAYAGLSGAAPADHVGKSLDEVFPLPAEVGADLRRVVTTSRTILGRSLRIDDGRERHFNVSYFPVRTSTGVLAGAGVTVIEVTEAKLAEAERAELLHRAEEAQQRLALLATASTVLSSTMDVDQLLLRLARVLTPGSADWCIIQLLEPDGSVEHVAVSHRDKDAADDLRNQLLASSLATSGSGPVAQVLRTGEALLLGPDSIGEGLARAAADRGQPQLYTGFSLRSSVIVPIELRGQRVGVLLLSSEGDRVLGDDDLDLAVEIAHRAALAVGNARAFQHEHRVAESFQRALLPTVVPSIGEVEFTVRYLAATDGVSVGGDWYDVIEFGDGEVGVVVGDVVGHDIVASTTMGQLRSALRAFACEDHEHPSGALARVDRLFGPLALASATCIFGVLEGDGGRFRWSNAGHPPPLLLRDGRATFLEEGNGVMLGVSDGIGVEEASVDLRDGDVLVLYTDGLVERRRESLTTGLERLATSAAALAGHAAADFCDRLLEAVLPTSAARDDDVAILVIGVGSHPAAAPVHRIPFEPVPESAGVARGFVTGVLAGAGWDDRIDTAVLLASELVTNASRHGEPPCTLSVTFLRDDVVEICVQDAAPYLPSRVDRGPLVESGRGLVLVEALSDDWGVRALATGKQVWFQLRR